MDSTEPALHAPDTIAGHIWRFADCEFDERRRELRVRGTMVEVEVKPLEVLHQLLLHAGEVVTKAEFSSRSGRASTVVDGSLATAVSKVRKLLGRRRRIVDGACRVPASRPGTLQSAPAPAVPDVQFESGQPIPGRDQWRLARRLDLSPSSEVWLTEHPKTRETRVFKFASDAPRLKCLKREVTVGRLLRDALGERPDFVRILEWNFDTDPVLHRKRIRRSEPGRVGGGARWTPQRAVGSAPEAASRRRASGRRRTGAGPPAQNLKPGNILIAPAPDGAPQIKIADFGSASLLAPARLRALGITNLGFTQSATSGKDSLTGTVLYVAPEVLAGQSPTAASDVFALGVLLYQLAAGDFRKPLAPGWEADIADPLIREDIADAACGDPKRRLKNAGELVDRLQNLDRRRQDAEEARRREKIATRRQTAARVGVRWLVLAGAALAVAAAVGVGVSRWSSAVTPPLKTVAVLPLQNARSDQSIDFLGRALADEIATALSHGRGLQVRPFAVTSKYDQPDIDLPTVAREMRADTLVTGRYGKADGPLHVTLEAVDVERNDVMWRDSFDAPAESLIAAQVQIALRVRGGLAPALGASSVDTSLEPRNEEAYELYLRSAGLPMVPAFNKQGLDMLERAVDLDPGYPPAWLALGRRYYTESRYGSGDPAMMSRYDAALERALSLDPNYVAAGAGLIVSRVERGDLVGAHQHSVDLVRRRPDSVEAQFVLSYVLRYAGLLDEAAERCEAALLLDRKMQTSGLRTCSMVFLLRGDYPRTMNYLRLDQGSDFSKALTIDMLARQGKTAEMLQLGSPNIPAWRSYDVLLACFARKPSSEVATLAEIGARFGRSRIELLRRCPPRLLRPDRGGCRPREASHQRELLLVSGDRV